MAKKSVHEPDLVNGKKVKKKSALLSEAGGFVASDDVKDDEFGSTVKSDNSHISAKFKDGSFWSFMPGRAIWKTVGDFCINVQRAFTVNVRGDSQFVYGGDHHVLHNGDHSVQVGNPSPEHKAAAIANAKILNKIQKEKIDATEQAAKDKEATIPCPICKTKYLEQKAFEKAQKAQQVIRKYFPHLPIPWDVIQKIIQYVITPFLGISSMLSLNGGKGCGSPGCVNGRVVDAKHAIDKGTKAGIAAYDANKDELQKNQKAMSEKGQAHQVFSGDTMLQFGVPGAQNKQPDHAEVGHKLNTSQLADAQAAKTQGFVASTKGSVKNMAYIPPEVGAGGSLHINVNENFTLSTGSPGVDIQSNGKVDIAGTKVNMTASQGELVMSSKNQTTISGGNVVIDGNNRSGDECILLNGNSYVDGILSVSGDLVIKGKVLADSSLHAPHLHVPCERISTAPSGNENMHAGMAVHNTPEKPGASILDKIDQGLKAVGRDLAWAVNGFLTDLGLAAVTKKAEEVYAKTMLAIPVDNHGLPVGYCWLVQDKTHAPIPVTVGDVVGYVTPVAAPIYAYPHTHYSTVDTHAHDQLILKGHTYDSDFDMRAARPAPSKVPMPPEAKGMGSAPGHKSITSCGGGGGGFNNGRSDRVNNAVLQRNAAYGIDGLNAFNGNIVPAAAKFTPEGDITPTPDFTMLNCN